MKDTFHSPSWETRIDIWVFPPISQRYPSHLGMVLEQLFWAQSFQRLLGSQGKNEASREGFSKLNPENGKSQSMAGSAALAGMSYNSLEEAWRTTPKCWLRVPNSTKQSVQTTVALGSKPLPGHHSAAPTAYSKALCLQGTTADLVVPVTRLPPHPGASP